MTTTRTTKRNDATLPPRSRVPADLGRDERGFALIMALVFLVLLTLLGALALRTSDFENMVAGGVQQAEVNFNVTEGGNYLEACNLGFVKRKWYELPDPEDTGTPMMPDEDGYNPGKRKDKNGREYSRSDYNKDDAPDNVRMWPFGNLRVGRTGEKDDGMVSVSEEDYKDGKTVERTPYDYRYLVTYMHYNTIMLPGFGSEVVGGFGTYGFRFQTSPGEQGSVVETAGIKYGMQQTL